jgi:AraC family transcriptional regulator
LCLKLRYWIEFSGILFQSQSIEFPERSVTTVKVAFETRGPVDEPYLKLNEERILGMTLRAGSMEIGLRRSALQRIAFDAGLMGLCPPQSEYWIGTCDMTHVTMTISDEALMAASDGAGNRIELRLERELVDPRLRALATAVEVERAAGFPSGRLFLDSIEQALARALVLGYGVRDYSARVYRGGLSPVRLRRIKELVQERMEEDLSLEEMARTVGLSTAHFSQVFRNTTGQTPHQSLLWHRVQRAKEMLRSDEMRVLDVAIACGFKTQQHFARVFREMCGASPTEYRFQSLR